jgi:CelD/BcsL family acetyltransferase involved in cellulose biosynthesis
MNGKGGTMAIDASQKLLGGSTLTARTVDPLSDHPWSQLVSSLSSSLFHSPQWMSVINKTYGIPLHARILLEQGRPVAGVAWCDVDDVLGRRKVTLAFSDYCDLLASAPGQREALAESIIDEGLPWVLRTLAKGMPEISEAPTHATHNKRHVIKITPQVQDMWGKMSSMAQRGVQKAQRKGMTTQLATDKRELREWYLLHLRLRKAKHGLLAQPYAFFENIWDAFIEKGQGYLMVAQDGDKIIAGTLYLLWKDTCYYKFNASDPDNLLLRPNNLLMWNGMLEARERGCGLLDLGRSSAHADGLINFKRGFGADEEDLHVLTYRPQNGAAGLRGNHEDEAKRLLNDLTRVFVQPSVPDGVSEEAGNLLYKYFT